MSSNTASFDALACAHIALEACAKICCLANFEFSIVYSASITQDLALRMSAPAPGLLQLKL